MRKPIIAGNWKMHKTTKEAVEFANNIKEKIETNVEAVICAPFTQLKDLKIALAGTEVKIGAQNFHYADQGAFTGEISASMLKEIGVDYVILGHSERRELFAETDQTVNLKTKKAIEAGITPIVCVGESLEQREAEVTKEVVKAQVVAGYQGISAEDAATTVIAYEPIWAIGTGKTATSEQANEVCKFIREVMASLYGQATADVIRIQYGGSVKPSNVAEIMGESDIDGALVGGASLVEADYLALMKF